MAAKIQTTANALNGQEIKDIIRMRMEKIIQDIPLLRVGTTFKDATVEFAFTMKAYPADIPVPDDFVMEFEILSPNEEDRASAENTKAFINKLIDQREEIIEKFETEIEKHVLIIEKGDSFSTAAKPDQTRLENDLPIPVLKETSTGQRAEVSVSASELGLPTAKGGRLS
jgi:hypothetical protein